MFILETVLIALFAAGLSLALIVVAASRHQKLARRELDLMGALASVETRLEPVGAVLIQGELWRARTSAEGTNVERGQMVRVVAARDYLLEVEPILNSK